MRIRIHFSKKGLACFISHTDLPMLFGRAARRAGLSPEQTQGFSPHPRLALCPPLPVGVIGLKEPADFWFLDWDDTSFKRWRSFLPQGIDILDARSVDGVSLNKLCSAAAYQLEPIGSANPDDIAAVLRTSLSAQDALLSITLSGKEIHVASCDLERCGPSFMVKSLVASGVISGWDELAIARLAVGQWDPVKMAVTPLWEDTLS